MTIGFGQNRQPFSRCQHFIKGGIGILGFAPLGTIYSKSLLVGFSPFNVLFMSRLWIRFAVFGRTQTAQLSVGFIVSKEIQTAQLWVGFSPFSGTFVSLLWVGLAVFTDLLAKLLWVGTISCFFDPSYILTISDRATFNTVFLLVACRLIFLSAPLTDSRLEVLHATHFPCGYRRLDLCGVFWDRVPTLVARSGSRVGLSRFVLRLLC